MGGPGGTWSLFSPITMGHVCVVLLLHSFFLFARGQGQKFTVYENLEPGSIVGTISTKLQHTYTFSEDATNAKAFFSLDSTTGTITTKVILDREALNLQDDTFYLLVLEHSTDTGGGNFPVEISIEILDKNDNDPTFSEKNITIELRENIGIGTTRPISTASDADKGVNADIHDYKVVSGDGPFKLVYDPAMYGEYLIIEVTGDLDREVNSFYTLTIIAHDNGSPPRTGSTTVNIHIDDENDNPPIFDPSTYYAHVNETDSIGTLVIQVNATDRDAGINQDVTFRILDDNDETNQFTIEANTGKIFTTVEPLSCQKQCLLTVEAQDHGTPPYTGRGFVYITVEDTNNHDPVITFRYVPTSNTEFSSINVDAKDGDVVAGVVIQDPDTNRNSIPSARIVAGNELNHFRFQRFVPGQYYVRVNGDSVLDRQRYHKYNLTIEADDGGSPPRISIAFLILYVNDINDNAPYFINKTVKLRISEATPVNSFIASMLATDLDVGINAQLTYTILSGNNRNWFFINSKTGLVTTSSHLHFEIQNVFKMNISVQDGALNPLKDFAELEISIWDENDIVPQFSQTVFNVTIEENQPTGQQVVAATATDADSGQNGTLTFAFHPHVEQLYPNTFYLDTNTGRVTTRKSLDREDVSAYVLRIIAHDNGPTPLSSTATVYLTIDDVNDNSPVFYPRDYMAKILEGQNVGTLVAQVTATDLDEGDNQKIIYKITGTDFSKFQIDSVTGIITTTQVLRKSDNSNYILNIVASDKFGQRSGSASVTIFVISPTDASIQFVSTSYSFNIPEDRAKLAQYVGVSVGSVKAEEDPARQSVLSYHIAGGDPAQVFTIDSNSGWIRRSKTIDREIFPEFNLKVIAVSTDTLAETMVHIKVTDVNDMAPVFQFSVVEVDLIENWPVGHHIMVASAIDEDEPGDNSVIIYSLQDDLNSLFGIDFNTGLIYLNKPLKLLQTKHVTLIVLAMDPRNVTNYATQELHMQVKDVNNHSPRFAQSTYQLSLSEIHPVNSRFYNVGAVDNDVGLNGELIFNITRGNEDGKFGIFPDGFLYIASPLDRETKDLYKLGVRATDKGQPSRSSECNITIHITDFNDNKPMFVNSSYTFYVIENKPANLFVGHVKASDDDVGRNAELSYYFLQDQTDFKLDSQTGELVTLKTFDREAYASSDYSINFDVVVKDSGLKRLQDLALVRVNLIDENDNAPKFRQPVYKVTVFENAPLFSNVTVVKAEDADAGRNKIITYDIISGNEQYNFKIQHTTGQISLNRTLDRETLDYYELKILATDSGEHIHLNDTAIVKVTVMDINDNFPLFAQSRMDISVKEDLLPGTLVAHFPAIDTDLGINAEISYTMSGQDDDKTFSIDHHTGKIYLLKKLDYETKKSYRLNVTATDSGVPPLPYYIRFSITVEDVNDNAPVFQDEPLVFSLLEHTQGLVGKVRALDADAENNGEVQYFITFQDPPGDNFKIVKSTGQIYNDKPVDREVTNMITLTVMAVDQADPSMRLSSETRIKIYINDSNDNSPQIVSFNAIAVPYGTPVNEFVATIQATDKDTGNNGRVSLQLLQSANYFGLDSDSGRFYVNQVLLMNPLMHSLQIRANDYGVSSRSTLVDFTVILTDDVGGPIFQNDSYTGSVFENSVAGVSIVRVLANSLRGSTVEYYVINITDSGSNKQVRRIFSVDKSSGVVSTAEVLDREELGSGPFDVTVLAVDMTGDKPRTSFVMARITVFDQNDTPPRFSQNLYSVAVDEDVRLDFPITKITVLDDDRTGGLQLTLNTTSDINLRIRPDGTVLTSGPLDREKQTRYTLQVTATDGKQSSTCVLQVNILDKNDNAPKFEQSFYSFDIDEDSQIDTTVGAVRAHDADSGLNSQVTYSLKSGWGNDTFVLDPVMGTFTLISSLHFEQTQLFTLVVLATDGGAPPLSSSVTVYFNIQDINDNKPVFELGSYTPAVKEDVAVGTSVVQVQAIDQDTGMNGQVRYSITDGDLHQNFAINPVSGVISTNISLDRETTAVYTLIVTATDMATQADQRLSSTVEVVITVLDVNDNMPVFVSPATIHVKENTPLSTICHKVLVQDLDEGDNSLITFTMTSRTGGTPFIISVNGTVRVNTGLDRETVQNFTMNVTATDHGSPALFASQMLVIVIEDVNDHAPVFSPEEYSSTQPENVKIGSTLLQVSATDLDSGDNGIVRYYIVGGDENQDFSLDQSSGVLRVQKDLDFERVTQYTLIVQAEDGGDNSLSATATISVEIIDLNDNKPVFSDSPFIGMVLENRVNLPVHVLNVIAQDGDSAQFSQLNYDIREGDRSLFNISASTGEILALKKLDRETQSEFVLTVIATDSTTGQGLTGSGTVSIFVEDVNDNPPMFEHNGLYVAHIPEDSPLHTEVITIHATDLDEGINAHIMYSLLSNQHQFHIEPDTGRITSLIELDRETVSEYSLIVVARDLSMLPLSSSTTVRVYVDDVNDNPPIFDAPSYSRTMMPAGRGTFVVGVTASDVDIGENGRIQYSMPSGLYSEVFHINPQTGVITLKQNVSAFQKYSLNIIATDMGGPPLSASVSVNVSVSASSGVTIPLFNPIFPGLTVMENTEVNSLITRITATIQGNASLQYRLVGGNTGKAFSIGPTDGQLRVARIIDYEVTPTFYLWVEAYTAGTSSPVSNFQEVFIQVLDQNDNPPRFDQNMFNVSVRENSMIGSPVVKVLASDADAGQNGRVSYSLQGDSVFIINSATGQITTFTNSLDREKIDMYSLLVVATDNGIPQQSSTASIRISITDENDSPPVFERQFNVKIPENTEVGSFVIRVTTTDKDILENAIATYTLTDDANGIFMIDSHSGNITLRKPLDAELKSNYRLRVSASDSAHDVGGNVEVEVSDINDNSPQLLQPFTFNFEEMLQPGSFVGQLKATDADITVPNNRTYFSLKQTSTYFSLDSDSGKITSLEKLTFDPNTDFLSLPNRHELVVIVKDLGTPARSSENAVYINIVDYNDHAPVFDKSSYQSAVPESATVGNRILTVQARDEFDFGVNKEVEYFMAGGNGSQYFDVDKYSGMITVRQPVSGLQGRLYTVTVRASDKGSPTQSATVQVRLIITGENRFAPEFQAPASRQISVPEDKAVGSLIETFSATDQDSGLNAEVVYETTEGDIDNLFMMENSTGKLLIKAPLDYEKANKYTLSIVAKDKGLISRSTTITYVVRLIDINDNDPLFRQTSDIIYVEENIPRGSSIYHAVATDEDGSSQNNKISYAIVHDANEFLPFNIDQSTGVITTKNDLDYESVMSYILTIMAFNDDSSHKSVMSLQVNIDGVNEYVPRFTQDTYYMSVSESAEERTSVGMVTATDNDAGEDSIVYYFLIGDSNTKGFKVDARSGVISVSGRPDYESSPEISLKVLAKNWGSVKGNDTDTCFVHISVQDANDPPVFTPDVYNPNIVENSPSGTSVITVTAADHDFDIKDREFSFQLLGGDPENKFKIDPSSGVITTTGRGSLDREQEPIITIIVGAVDTGTPPETGSATVNIHLEDVNDNSPTFTNFTATVQENKALSTLVTNLRQYTQDPDEYSNNPNLFTYHKVPSTGIEVYSYFDIGNSGDVVTMQILDRETISEFMVPVIVKDGGSPLMSSTLSFKIQVEDVDDSPPKPRNLSLFLSLYDGHVPHNPIANVKPFDKDITSSHICNLTSTNTPFAILPNSCDLVLQSFPVGSSYSLQVTGSDGVSGHTSANYDVSVTRIVFDNQTLSHSIIIQLASLSANDFVNFSYTKFIAAIRKLFDPQDDVEVSSVTEQKTGELLVFLAVYQKTIKQYYSSAFIAQKLKQNQLQIDAQANVFTLKIGYSTCSNAYCPANQRCESQISVSASGHIADSPYKVFSYPELSLGYYCAYQCGNTYCQNNGECVNNKCSCPSSWTGTSCEVDVDECLSINCQNDAICINKPGSFYCQCHDGFSGIFCEQGQDNCVSNPCFRGTCKNKGDGFLCQCPYGYHGDRCEHSSRGFGVGSFLKLKNLTSNETVIEVMFATHRATGLLLYNPSNGLVNDFLALEIVGSRLQLSVALDPQQVTNVTMDANVSTGDWFKVKVNRTGSFMQLWLEGGQCTPCSSSNCCYKNTTLPGDGSLDVGSHPLYFAGVKDIGTILQKQPTQVKSHDFVGCVQLFEVDGKDQLDGAQEMSGVMDSCPRTSATDPCLGWDCHQRGTCMPEWPQPICNCMAQYSGPHCEQELHPFGFVVDSHVKIILREDVRRDLQLAAKSRWRRAVTLVTQSDVMVRFRTTANNSLIMFASTLDAGRYSALAVVGGQLRFLVSMFGGENIVNLTSTPVNDGEWHNVTVTITDTTVSLLLDSQHQQTLSIQAFMFTSLDVKELLLGGATSALTIDNKSVRDLDGCISMFYIDGKALPLNGTTDRYTVQVVGGVTNGCDRLCIGVHCNSGSCVAQGEETICPTGNFSEDKALGIGIIVVIVFFVVLIIAIIVVFIVFRHRGHQMCFPKKESQKQNGAMLSKGANSSGHSHQDSGYGENNIDELIIRNHIAQELKSNNMHPGNSRVVQPDLIGTERSRSHLPYEIEDGTVIIDNASDLTNLRDLQGEAPELYDLENASSIAPSDIDVVDHYKHFHDGGRSRRKNKTSSNHSSYHHSQHSSRQYGPGSNHSTSHSHNQMRDSPNQLSSVPYLNDLARSSPAVSGRNNQSLINQLSRQSPNMRQSPLTHVNMHGMPVTDLNTGSRTTSEHSLASHRSKNSTTPHKPVRQMLPNGNPNSKVNNNYESKQFLTLEEVDRLNSRPRESPVSLMEAFSTSSENNTRKMKKPFEQYQDTSVLLEPPESSSDDSANDSFTCSEFEYENDKQKNDFTSKFSNLDEVDNENEDGAHHNKVFKSDDFDFGGNSFSSNIGSLDESQNKGKESSPYSLNWDDLLNWGPKFEKLVGVFTDIALLPDADNMDFSKVEGKVPDQEEYV